MPRWRAVAFGVGVALLLAFFAHLVPVVGHAMIGFGAGFVAGALGGGRLRGGVEHGFTAGVASALLVGLVSALSTLAVGSTGSPLARTLGDLFGVYGTLLEWSDELLLSVGLLVLVLSSLLAGALGGVVRGDRRLPRLPPEERAREREGDR